MQRRAQQKQERQKNVDTEKFGCRNLLYYLSCVLSSFRYFSSAWFSDQSAEAV